MKRSAFGLFCLLVACGDPPPPAISMDPHQDYEDENVTVLGGDDRIPIATGQVSQGEDCLQLDDETCVPVDRTGKYCKDGSGPVDVVVVDGEVVQIVCYEDADTTEGPSVVVTSSAGDVEVAQMDNGGVVTFGAETDGVPIEGDVTVDGNNVSVYGNGPDNTIIEGNLTITGNNARVRGIHVMGNVIIDLNTAAFLLSEVDGNVVVRSNNSLVAAVRVHGNVEVPGNNTILVQNEVAGAWQIEGQGSVCDDNVEWVDDAAGETLTCP